jgi:hypothetical protein
VSESKKIENNKISASDDSKAKMLAALAKKQKGHITGKSSSLTGISKIRTGQTAVIGTKMHRRKAGSA